MADIDVSLGLNPSDYVQGAQTTMGVNQQLIASMSSMQSGANLVQRTIDMVTPKRTAVIGMGLFTAAAVAQQQAMSGLAANQAITSTRSAALNKEINGLARTFPVGNAGARQLVTTFTQLGVNGAGVEKRIGSLSKTVVRMSGAVSEATGGLASGMVQLSRAMGDDKLDPGRFAKMGDAAVQVSKDFGASTTSVLEFSRYIAPMARQAGIGQTSVLGMSAAFARLGDDGTLAGNAVNKMIGDLSSSVRDGGPQLATYARIVGQTTKQFQALYKASPMEAITKITEAIGSDPTVGGRDLQRIGLEGPRTQRLFASLAQSGGLRKAVSDAVGAYGNGAAQRGSQAAYGGITDSFVKLQASSEQLAQAFGAPLLGPLGKFINMITRPLGGLASAAGSPLGSGLLTTAAYGGLAAFLGKRVLGMGATVGLGRLAGLSFPARGFFGGAFGGPESSYLAPVLEAQRAGTLRPYQAYALAAGRQIGRFRAEPKAYAEGTLRETLSKDDFAAYQRSVRSRNPVARFGQSALFWGSQAAVGYGNLMGSAQAQSNELYHGLQARDVLSPRYGGAVKFGLEQAKAQGLSFKAVSTGLSSFRAEVERTQAGFGNLRRFLGGMTFPFAATARMGAQMGGTALSAVAAGGSKLIGALGGPGLALAGGFYGFSQYRAAAGKSAEETDRLKNMSISSTLDDYRNATGRATDATITMADQIEQVGRQLERSVKSIKEARKVNDDDVAYARQTMSKQIRQFGGTSSQVAAQVSAISASGLSAQDLQDVKVDLLRSHDRNFVGDVMSQIQLPGGRLSVAQQSRAMQGLAPAALNAAAIIGHPAAAGGIWNNLIAGKGGNVLTQALHDPGGLLSSVKGVAGFFGYHPFSAGHAFNSISTSKDTNEKLDTITQGIGQQYTRQTRQFGGDYAQQERLRSFDKAFADIAKTGNKDLIAKASEDFSVALTGKRHLMTADDIKGSSFVQALADKHSDFGKVLLEDQRTRNISLTSGGLTAHDQVAPIARDMKQFGVYGSFFNNLGPQADRQVNRKVAAFANAPEDAAKLQAAVESMINSGRAAGESLVDLATKSQAAANKIQDPTDPNYGLNLEVAARAKQEIGRQAPFQSSVTTLKQQLAIANKNAALIPTSPEQAAVVKGAKQDQIDLTQQLADAYKARIMAQFQYQVQSTRAYQDYHLQVLYAEQDFGRSMVRAEQDYNTQRSRMARNYTRQTQRAEADFDKQRSRSIEDYNLQVARSEEDFHISRLRANRDFGIQMARASQDAAKGMYDPYHRIQTQAVYDGQNLLLNLQEQQKAMEGQAKDLAKARKSGLTDATIDMLGLNKAENAQQLSSLVADIANDPKLAAQLNKTTQSRTKAGSAVYNDSSNVEVKRAKADFHRQLKDQEQDYTKSLTRQAADFAKQLGRSYRDFNLSLSRAQQDYDTALGDMYVDYHRVVHRAEVDHQTQMDRLNTAFKTSMTRMQEDLANSQKEIALSFEKLQQATQKAMANKAQDWGKILVDPLKGQLKALGQLVPPFAAKADDLASALINGSANAAQINKNALGGILSPTGTGNANVPSQSGLPGLLVPGTHAQGGPIYGPGSGTSDHVPAWLSNGEHVWTAREVANAGGHAAVEALRSYFADGPKYAAGGKVSWGDPADPNYAAKHITTAHAAGLAFEVNKAVANRFVYLVDELLSEHYTPRTIMGYARRPIAGTHTWSNHAYGAAIDVDPSRNPRYPTGAGGKYALPENSDVLAARAGLFWGGQYLHSKDYMHFEALGAPATYTAGRAGPNGVSTAGYGGFGPPNPRDYLKHGLMGVLMLARDVKAWMGGASTGSGGSGSAPSNVSGNVALAKRMAGAYRGGWGSGQEWNDLYWLWNQESGFRTDAGAPSHAYGIPQALPGSKMRSAGLDWLTNPATQIRWGLGYIGDTYGDPSGAVRHKHATDSTRGSQAWGAQPGGWYGAGGIFTGPRQIGVAERGPEAVIPLNEAGAGMLASALSKYVNADEAARSMTASSGRTHIVYDHSVHSYDQRNDFGGANFTIQSNDPNDMARKLEAKQRADNLVRGRR